MVGATGFEPATSCSRSRRATGLRYAPPNNSVSHRAAACMNAPRRTRTSNLLIRSQMLYPIELWAPDTRLQPTDETAALRNHSQSHNFGHRSQSYFRTKVESSQSLPLHASCAHTRRVDRLHFTTIQQKTPRNVRRVMGGTRLELVTSTMSTWRSNQLS